MSDPNNDNRPLDFLDGLVVINSERYTSVELREVRLERWSSGRIAKYEHDLARWKRRKWVHRIPLVGWRLGLRYGIPKRMSPDRDLIVSELHIHNPADGKTDATSALQSAFDAGPYAGGMIHVGPGSYPITNLDIQNNGR